jgi:hypothetical protein
MQNNRIHLIAFNIPYPANYGGVIDVFFKLKALHKIGYKVILHCFDYGRGFQSELEQYSEEVCYYPRKIRFKQQFSLTPFIVKSRQNNQLLERLLQDDNPIIFEGLHTCFFLSHPKLKERVKIVRTHNIEHKYYFNLYKSSTQWSSKLFFLFESWKLKRYEKILKFATSIATISLADQDYFEQQYGKSFYLPPFHPSKTIEIKEGHGDYIIYHGNLSVPENEYVVRYVLNEIAPKIAPKIVIAGSNPSLKIEQEISKSSNVLLKANPENQEMNDLLLNAQIHLLLSKNSAGVKIKLIQSLFIGRFCVVNNTIAEKSILPFVEIVDLENPSEIVSVINSLWDKRIDENAILKRKQVEKLFSNSENIKLLISKLQSYLG